MKKKVMLSVMACAVVFISCEKDEVVNEETVNQEENVVYMGPLGGEQWTYVDLYNYNPDTDGCNYPGTDCFSRASVAVHSVAHNFIDEPTIWDDKTAMQDYVADHHHELEPYFHVELLDAVVNGDLSLYKNGSFDPDGGGIVYLMFLDSDSKVFRVQPFALI